NRVGDLPQGAVVGTSSPRRRAQLLRERPDLEIVLLRGNVDTRRGKVASGEVHATLLAAAGLDRLGRDGIGVAVDAMLPAPAQGAVGIEVLAASASAVELVSAIDHRDTHECVLAERSLLAGLSADCHSPVAALAVFTDGVLTLSGELLTEDGDAHVTGSASGEHAGQLLAQDLLARAPEAVRRLFGK
ncbi:MAG TPA: hydroxymethylbilane synthase, partial [Sphingomicrobium sp.]